MLSVGLFILALVFSSVHAYKSKDRYSELLLRYILFFNMGLMGLLATYAHVWMGPATAAKIGWQAGSPFQFEIGMANLSYGVLGIFAFYKSRDFATAAIIGWSILLLGCFVGHLINYYETANAAPYNIGVYVWFNDLMLPILALGLNYRAAFKNDGQI